MAQLAIKGHATRGKEVIEILEMLGGKNDNHCCGGFINRIYFVNENGYIESCDRMHHLDYAQLTIEEFLEKYPYKVGDKVVYKPIQQINTIYVSEIISMRWLDNSVVYYTSNGHEVYVCDLQPYKEQEIMEDIEIKFEDMISLDYKKIDNNKHELVLPKDYEIIIENKKPILIKKQPQYPKTYKECFRTCFGNKHHIIQVVGLDGLDGNKDLFENFIKLKICRDAYWKIAGDWKPDWKTDEDGYNTVKFCIKNFGGEIRRIDTSESNTILAFPTEEMRDAFYENFKELINECKELL